MARKIIAIILSLSFLFSQTGFAQVVAELNFSGYLKQPHLTADKFRPLHLRYFSYDLTNNDFRILLDKGDEKELQGVALKNASQELLNHFLIGITLPNDDFWVNLRPDSENQIITDDLARTDMGRVMLEADLQLKKDTARFTSPQTSEGRAYWDKLYKKAGELFGTQSVNIPTLTRPWIVPNEIIIRETPESAYVYKATMKVMLEQDHLKNSAVYDFKDDRLKALNEYSSQLIRETILPKLTKEVNVAKRYAPLRQVFYSLVLARWFKSRYIGKAGIYARLIDQKNLAGLTSKSPWSKTTYFKEYQKSFKDGEYNLQETVNTPSGQAIRSYFSGGIAMTGPLVAGPGVVKTGAQEENPGAFKGGATDVAGALLDQGKTVGFEGKAGTQGLTETRRKVSFAKMPGDGARMTAYITIPLPEKNADSYAIRRAAIKIIDIIFDLEGDEVIYNLRDCINILKLANIPAFQPVIEILERQKDGKLAISQVKSLLQEKDIEYRARAIAKTWKGLEVTSLYGSGGLTKFIYDDLMKYYPDKDLVKRAMDHLGIEQDRQDRTKIVYVRDWFDLPSHLRPRGLPAMGVVAITTEAPSPGLTRIVTDPNDPGRGGKFSFAKQPSLSSAKVSAPPVNLTAQEAMLVRNAAPASDLQGLSFGDAVVNVHILDRSLNTEVLFSVDGALNLAMRVERTGTNIIDVYVTEKAADALRKNKAMLDALIEHEVRDTGEEGAHRKAWQAVKAGANRAGMMALLKFVIDTMDMADTLSLVSEYEADLQGKGEGRIKSGEWNDFEKEIYEYCKDRISHLSPHNLVDLARIYGDGELLQLIFGSKEQVQEIESINARLKESNVSNEERDELEQKKKRLIADKIEALAKAWDVDRFVVEARIVSAFLIYSQLKSIKSANDAVRKGFESKTPQDVLLKLAKATHQSWLETVKGPKYVAYTRQLHELLLGYVRSGKVRGITEEQFSNPKKKFKIKAQDFIFFGSGSAEEKDFAQKFRALTGKDYTAVLINTVAGEWEDLSGWSQARDAYLYGLQADNVGAIINALNDPDLVSRLSRGTDEEKMQAIVEILRRINAGWRLNNPWGGFTDKLIYKPFDLEENGGIGLNDIMKDFMVLKAILQVLNVDANVVNLDVNVEQAIAAAYDAGLERVFEQISNTSTMREAIRENSARRKKQPTVGQVANSVKSRISGVVFSTENEARSEIEKTIKEELFKLGVHEEAVNVYLEPIAKLLKLTGQSGGFRVDIADGQGAVVASPLVIIPKLLQDLVVLFGEQGAIDTVLNYDVILGIAKAWDADLWRVEFRLRSSMSIYSQLKSIKSANDAVRKGFESKTPQDVLLKLAKATHQSWLETVKGPKYVAYTRQLHELLLGYVRSGKVRGITEEQFSNPKKKFKIKAQDFVFFGNGSAEEKDFAQKFRALTGKDYTAVLINTVAGEWEDLSGWSQARDAYLYGLQADNVGAIINALNDPDLVSRFSRGTDEEKMQAIVEILRRINAGWRLNNPWGGFTDALLHRPFAIGDGGIGVDEIRKDMTVLRAILNELNEGIRQGKTIGFADVLRNRLTQAFDSGLGVVLDSMMDSSVFIQALERDASRTPGNRRVSFTKMPGTHAAGKDLDAQIMDSARRLAAQVNPEAQLETIEIKAKILIRPIVEIFQATLGRDPTVKETIEILNQSLTDGTDDPGVAAKEMAKRLKARQDEGIDNYSEQLAALIRPDARQETLKIFVEVIIRPVVEVFRRSLGRYPTVAETELILIRSRKNGTDSPKETAQMMIEQFRGGRSFAKMPGQSYNPLYDQSGNLRNSPNGPHNPLYDQDGKPRNPSSPGGIDFRTMNILTQPMGSFSGLRFTLPKLSNLDKINIDEELQQLQSMIKSGIIPSGQRVKEFLAACCQKNEMARYMDDTIICLADICRLEEEALTESSPELKEALVIADTNKFVVSN